MPTPPAGLRAAPATEIRPLDPAAAEDTYVLAVDLGTGGPKVAVISATGRIAAHAFQPVGVDLTDDGGAEQSPRGLVGRHRGRGPPCARRQRRGARAGRRRRLHLAVVGHRARRRRRAGPRPGHHLDGLAGRPRRPRDGPRRAQRAGLLRLQAGTLGAAHRGDPEPVGQGPRGPHPLPARAASRGLRRDGRLPRAGRLPQPAPDRAGPGLARLHHRALGHRQPGHLGHRL